MGHSTTTVEKVDIGSLYRYHRLQYTHTYISTSTSTVHTHLQTPTYNRIHHTYMHTHTSTLLKGCQPSSPPAHLVRLEGLLKVPMPNRRPSLCTNERRPTTLSLMCRHPGPNQLTRTPRLAAVSPFHEPPPPRKVVFFSFGGSPNLNPRVLGILPPLTILVPIPAFDRGTGCDLVGARKRHRDFPPFGRGEHGKKGFSKAAECPDVRGMT